MKVTIGHTKSKDLIIIDDVDTITRHTNFIFIRTATGSYTYPWRVVLSVRVDGDGIDRSGYE